MIDFMPVAPPALGSIVQNSASARDQRGYEYNVYQSCPRSPHERRAEDEPCPQLKRMHARRSPAVLFFYALEAFYGQFPAVSALPKTPIPAWFPELKRSPEGGVLPSSRFLRQLLSAVPLLPNEDSFSDVAMSAGMLRRQQRSPLPVPLSL